MLIGAFKVGSYRDFFPYLLVLIFYGDQGVRGVSVNFYDKIIDDDRETSFSFLSLLREEREGKLHGLETTTTVKKQKPTPRSCFAKKCTQHLLGVRNYAEKLQKNWLVLANNAEEQGQSQ
jgi:hypothetical protein